MSIGVSPIETRLEVQKLNELPAMSLVAQQFLEAVEDTDIEVRKLGQIIEKDPALTARIIGLANAAYFGLSERVTTVEQAIFKVLGVNTAKSLALSIILSGPFDDSRCPGFDLGRYWTTALATATLSQRLAPLVRVDPKPQPSEAYLCGLLHDLGVLALVHLFADRMSPAFSDGSVVESDEVIAFERETLGADHHQVGGWLARKWHLPPLVVATIEHYSDRQYRERYWPVVRLVGFAHVQAVRIAHGDETLGTLDRSAEALGMNPRRVASVVDELRETYDEIAASARRLVS